MFKPELPTPQLIQLTTTYLTSLGFPGVSSDERWEQDGVFTVGSPPRDPDVHWYLWVSGTENPFYGCGITLVLIKPKGEFDVEIELESLDQLPQLLTQHKHYPLS